MRRWTVPEINAVPDWLPDLAEALAGKRDTSDGGSVPVPADRIEVLRQRATAFPADSLSERWLHWFLFERLQSSDRPVGAEAGRYP